MQYLTEMSRDLQWLLWLSIFFCQIMSLKWRRGNILSSESIETQKNYCWKTLGKFMYFCQIWTQIYNFSLSWIWINISRSIDNCLTNVQPKTLNPRIIPKSPKGSKIPESVFFGDKIPKVGHPTARIEVSVMVKSIDQGLKAVLKFQEIIIK